MFPPVQQFLCAGHVISIWHIGEHVNTRTSAHKISMGNGEFTALSLENKGFGLTFGESWYSIVLSFVEDERVNMDFDNNEQTDRRRFLKGAAGVAVGCACLSLDCSQENSSERRIADGKGKVHLAAACGTYCGACPAYLARHGEDEQTKMRQQKRPSSGPTKALKGIPPSNWMDGLLCDGCLSGGVLAAHCQRCDIRLHALNKQSDSRCTDCGELPCYRITNLINMGRYLHRQEYLPNLKKIREMGVQEWVRYEEERWRCPRCGLPMSWYDGACAGCGEPRSKDLFPLE